MFCLAYVKWRGKKERYSRGEWIMKKYGYVHVENAYAIEARTESETKIIRNIVFDKERAKKLADIFNNCDLDILHLKEVMIDMVTDELLG